MKRSIPPLCIAIVALVIAVQTIRRRGETQAHNEGSEPAATPCSDKQLAWVDGLGVGQTLGDFRVTGFRCPETRILEIELQREKTPLVLIVAEPGAVPHNAPRQTKDHDLFYNKQNPENEPPTQQDIDKLLELLGKRVEAAEKKTDSGK